MSKCIIKRNRNKYLLSSILFLFNSQGLITCQEDGYLGKLPTVHD